MASSFDVAFWWARVWGSLWLAGRGIEAMEWARSMQRLIPAIETSAGHHLSLTWGDLKEEKIRVSVLQKSREEDCPAWGRRLVILERVDHAGVTPLSLRRT
jgi:hypothetical protein